MTQVNNQQLDDQLWCIYHDYVRTGNQELLSEILHLLKVDDYTSYIRAKLKTEPWFYLPQKDVFSLTSSSVLYVIEHHMRMYLKKGTIREKDSKFTSFLIGYLKKDCKAVIFNEYPNIFPYYNPSKRNDICLDIENYDFDEDLSEDSNEELFHQLSTIRKKLSDKENYLLNIKVEAQNYREMGKIIGKSENATKVAFNRLVKKIQKMIPKT